MRQSLGEQRVGKLNLIHGYWQMPLAPGVQEIFTIVTLDDVITPTGVRQGVLNAKACFQGVLTDILQGLKYKVWVEVVFC